MTWAAEIADAAAGIKEGFRGLTGAIVKRGAAGGSAHNPTPGADTSHSCYLGEVSARKDEIDGTLIQQSDRVFMVSTEGLSVAPETTDRLSIGGASLAIVDVRPFQPGGEVIYWRVFARGS